MIKKESQIIVNGDDFYASVLQKIISKNLSIACIIYFIIKILLWKMMTCVCADDKLIFIEHLYANTPEKFIK